MRGRNSRVSAAQKDVAAQQGGTNLAMNPEHRVSADSDVPSLPAGGMERTSPDEAFHSNMGYARDDKLPESYFDE